MIHYLITITVAGSVQLSRRGQWGNMPHASEEAAREAAELDAKGKPFQIQRLQLKV